MAASARAGSAESKEIKSLREQLAGSKAQAQELMTKLERVRIKKKERKQMLILCFTGNIFLCV
jgi:hypothetical protein